jgi:serine protease AprX
MVFARSVLVCCAVLCHTMAFSQVNRYMVFFKDKNGSPYSTERPGDFLSEKAIARRVKQGLEISLQDIPVNHNYVSQVRSTGANVFFQSKWFNGVLVQCNANLRATIAALPFVDRVDLVAPGQKLIPSGGRRKFTLKRKVDGVETEGQLKMLGIDEMHQKGLKGEGITIALLDAGYIGVNTTQPFKHLFEQQKLNEDVSYDFVGNTGNVFQYDDHGTEVLSVIAGEIPDAFTGGAGEADFQLYVTEDAYSEYRIEEYNWVFAAERADSAGVDIINSSLGYYDFDDATMNYTKAQMDGNTAVVSKAAQWAADRGILVVVSAGNEGNIPSWRIITAPADAKDVLAVAGVNAQRERSPSSSIGPSADGRTKPDVAALGVNVRTVKSSGNIGATSGTSLAAPLITSLAAGVWQLYPDLSNLELMALIKASASRTNMPDNFVGYGIPNFRAIVNYNDTVVQNSPFAVFPNPATDTVFVRPLDPETSSTARIELFSSLGARIGEATTSFSWLDRRYQADISKLHRGYYYIRVWFEGKRYVFKILKE